MSVIFTLFFASLIGIGALLWMSAESFYQLIPTLSVKQLKGLSLGYITIGFLFIFFTHHATFRLVGLTIAGLYSAGVALYLGFKQRK
ncbi:hypothetical protein [Dolosicoccus paucivorans]|uniref:Uncharacterized protein n=1 Tax=Dolosicoccus paucivorans TaxID=84521 RepID=A0A1G8PNY6_9LACT|nr:hypothetical protein [Dolosicoccus paucivorans]PMB84593.1 hypothetical protein CJ206_02920 [Dolosicoccus paucivorans]PMC58158.1 hypothetical protein CJ205_05815 [Dolosicoccus paucivorans]SDI94203.1 hypothetical protein SAMN04487994_10804 [Dolosicoccus paucivorans]